jgi:hypothetical protein
MHTMHVRAPTGKPGSLRARSIAMQDSGREQPSCPGLPACGASRRKRPVAVLQLEHHSAVANPPMPPPMIDAFNQHLTGAR